MRILFTVPYVPNLVRTRPYNLIRHLSARGHEITLLTVWSNEQERADLEPLQKICHKIEAVHVPTWRSLMNCLTVLPSKRPFQSVFSWHENLVSSYNGTSPFDVAHVEHLRGSKYGLYLKEHTKLPVIWDSVDCISHLFEQAAEKSESTMGRMRSKLELGRTQFYEGWLLDKFEHVLVTSSQDKAGLIALKRPQTEASPISVLHNGVDFSHFEVDESLPREEETVVISGKMSYHANVSMVKFLMDDIMPLVWQKRPQVKVWIVGKDPTPDIQAWDEHPCVTVTGTVPEIRPYLQKATCAVTPITYGAGIQNKVLEAMACGTPVVTTSKAVSAIDVTSGKELLIADTAQAFADEICSIISDKNQQKIIGQAGRDYVEANHHWNSIAANLEKIYQTAIEK
ncbi:MAG: glycosyltransferase [Chloroflexota bacterium]